MIWIFVGSEEWLLEGVGGWGLDGIGVGIGEVFFVVEFVIVQIHLFDVGLDFY